METADSPDDSRQTAAILLTLTASYAALVAMTWARWGDFYVDSGTAIDRAARIASGQILYRDVLSPYGPVAAELTALAMRWFGAHLTTVYSIGIALAYAQGMMLFAIGRRVLGAWEAAFAALLFWMLLAVQPGLTSWIVPNTFASTFGAVFATATLAAVLAASEHRTAGRWACASCFAALAGLSTIELGAAAVGTILLALLVCDRRPRSFAAAIVPGLAIALAVVAWVCWRVPVEQLIEDNLYRKRTLDLIVSATRSWADFPLAPRLSKAALHFGLEFPLRVIALAWGVAQLRRPGAWRVLGAALAIAALLLPLLPGYAQPSEFAGLRRGMQYYWAPTVWLLVFAATAVALWRQPTSTARALLVIAGFALLLSLRWNLRMRLPSYYGFTGPLLLILVVRSLAWAGLRRRPPQWAVIAVFATALAAAQQVNWATFRARSEMVSFPRGTFYDTPRRARTLRRVIERVRAETQPDDYIAVVPEERIITFLSERRNPTRDSGIGPKYLANEADERAYVAELEARRTQLVIISKRHFPEFGYGQLSSYNPLVARHFETAYHRVGRIGAGRYGFDILARGAGGKQSGQRPIR